MTDTQAAVTFTKPGYIWSEVVNEIDWLQEDEGDLSDAMGTIEDQLPDGYWDSEVDFTITVSPAIAATIRQVENTDTAERAELDRKLAERDKKAMEGAQW